MNFKQLFESTDCALIANGRVMRYLAEDGVSSGDKFQLKVDNVCWLSAGQTDGTDHHGEVWCRFFQRNYRVEAVTCLATNVQRRSHCDYLRKLESTTTVGEGNVVPNATIAHRAVEAGC